MMDMSNRPVDGLGRYGNPETKIEFTPPENLDLQGESGEALVKWQKNGDKICLVSMDGVALPGYENGQDTEDTSDASGADEEADA